MFIRPLLQSDLLMLKAIWEKYYQNEFPWPEWSRNWLSQFIISDENGELITAGGVKLFTEIVLVTDQDTPARSRHNALQMALQIGRFVSQSAGHNNLYASAQGEWEKILLKVGFTPSKDNNLVIG